MYLLRLLRPSIQVSASYSSPFYFFFDFFIAIAIALPARPIRPITTTCGILSLPFNTALIQSSSIASSIICPAAIKAIHTGTGISHHLLEFVYMIILFLHTYGTSKCLRNKKAVTLSTHLQYNCLVSHYYFQVYYYYFAVSKAPSIFLALLSLLSPFN